MSLASRPTQLILALGLAVLAMPFVPDRATAQSIDLTWSTTASGALLDTAFASALRSDGTVVIAGSTSSGTFPIPGVVPPTGQGNDDAFVLCFDPAQTGAAQLVWTAFLGGNGLDVIYELVVDDADRVWVTGYTESNDFPTTPGAYQTVRLGVGDGFAARLDSGGALEWSTYFGGALRDASTALFVDGVTAWIAGTTGSSNLATTPTAFQPTFGGALDIFLAHLNPAVSGSASLEYATYLGGSGEEGLFPASIGSATFDVDRVSIDRNAAGHIAIAGSTTSANFPVTPTSLQPTIAGDRDTCLTILAPSELPINQLIYSTFLGGSSEEQAFEVRWLEDGSCAFAGTTVSANFPTHLNAFQTTYGGGAFDGFVARIQPAFSGVVGMITSTYFGGSGDDSITGLAVIDASTVAVVGNSRGPVITTGDAFFPNFTAGNNFAGRLQIFDLDAGGNGQMLFSTYLSGPGGSVTWGVSARAQTLSIAGWTSGDDFPLANPFSGPVDFIGIATALVETPFVSDEPQFERADVNGDGSVNIADAISGLGILFGNGVSTCDDANDANDDGSFNIADMIYLLGSLFQQPANVIPEPTSCGVDPTGDGLRCAEFSSCP